MKSAFEFLALCSCGLFAGAALYINLVEHPARMSCDVAVALTEFRPSYKRATVMQASLAAVSFATGIATWLEGASLNWLIGSLLIGAVIPFTLIVILPTNRRLLDPALNPTSDSALQLLRHWGRLHSVRAVLSLAAFGFFAGAMISGRHCDTPVWVSGDSVLGARESVLRQDLFMLRLLVSQYTLDKQETPKSLEDLVKAGYLKQIPVDPITGKADWCVDVIMDPVQHEPGISSVRSSSQKMSSDRTVYSTW